MRIHQTWRVRGIFGDVELVPAAGRVDADAIDGSVRELRHVLLDPGADMRRALPEVHAWLYGAAAHCSRGVSLEAGRTSTMGEDLLRAARARWLLVRRRERRRVVVVLQDDDEWLGPDTQPPEPDAWIAIVLLDQTGNPVPRKPYRIITPKDGTYDGQLDEKGFAKIVNIHSGNCQIVCPYVDPHPDLVHVVKQGEHMSGIAAAYGYDDYTQVWSRSENADLQGQRSDPHVLSPGDQAFVPAIGAPSAANKPTGAKHPFTTSVSPLKLRLKLLDLAAKPLAGTQVSVDHSPLTTDGDGLVEAAVDKGATDVQLQAPNAEIDLSVGALNPFEDTTDAGYKARLFNLGFLWDPSVEDDDPEMAVACEDFQAQYGLPMTRQLDAATKAQLARAYGS
jgi:hypothetical protein